MILETIDTLPEFKNPPHSNLGSNDPVIEIASFLIYAFTLYYFFIPKIMDLIESSNPPERKIITSCIVNMIVVVILCFVISPSKITEASIMIPVIVFRIIDGASFFLSSKKNFSVVDSKNRKLLWILSVLMPMLYFIMAVLSNYHQNNGTFITILSAIYAFIMHRSITNIFYMIKKYARHFIDDGLENSAFMVISFCFFLSSTITPSGISSLSDAYHMSFPTGVVLGAILFLFGEALKRKYLKRRS
ncbi:hypothetical protein [Azospirillum sp. Sh1]|uniref:hypothetical protein n=1 Tax=Azospirillum sp. Sh1 TaxID=2607285 RepID=UPI0011EBE16B|nr:hypothetical protein [Azospirillum sp. Sh1]KAA0573815.1 hypothetical protein FZ029_19555 [Azospirillum sp. Sh1]